MSSDPKLEAYLAALDRALGQIPVSERADIITEIKSHVLDALERDPTSNINKILASLGEPEAVANRYLLERGLTPVRTSSRPMLKWLTIGFLGTFAISVLAILIVVWNFTPLISVDEEKDRVIILGGLIDVNGDDVNIGSSALGKTKKITVKGDMPELGRSHKEIQVSFTNGKFELVGTEGEAFRWDCKVYGDKAKIRPTEIENGAVKFDFAGSRVSKCDLEIPKGVKVDLKGTNGKVELEDLRGDVDVSVSNGKVRFTPAPNTKYRYDIDVTNGRVDDFESSKDPDAFLVKMNVINGKVSFR